MGDAEIEGAAQDRAAGLENVDPAEILPQAERDAGRSSPLRPQRR